MIKEIRVKNYKAFQEAIIPIRPITLLLGANSAGKSSIIQLFMLLQQTAEEANQLYKSALKTSGKRINIGDVRNLFPNKNTKENICIKIDFDDIISDNLIRAELIEFIFQYNFDIRPLYYVIKKNGQFTDTEAIRNNVKKYIEVYTEDCNKEGKNNFSKDELIEQITRYFFFLFNTQRVWQGEKEIEFELSYSRKHLINSAFSITIKGKQIISYHSNTVASDILDFTIDEKKCLQDIFYKNRPIFYAFTKPIANKRRTLLVNYITNIINMLLTHLQEQFSGCAVNHVSPLRAHPQRYYMLDEAEIQYSLNTLDANAIAEVLKDASGLNQKVNSWFKKYNLKINVETFKEAIYKMSVTQSGIDLDITDVGFGISQVLPVIMQGFLSPKESITLIEQPEIHLHPKMQAELADLLIDIVKEQKYGKSLVVETHSEYLLRRLRRRMAEGIDIKPENVSILLFQPRTNDSFALIKNLPIESKGAFEWPEEYYGDELYKDITEFLKLQSNANIHTND